MKYDIKCSKCGILLNFDNIGRVSDLNGRHIRSCKDCEEGILTELKAKRFVESYNNSNIYQLDGKYVPYWGCSYYFTNIEDCRQRIDNKNIAVVPVGFLTRVAQGKSLL